MGIEKGRETEEKKIGKAERKRQRLKEKYILRKKEEMLFIRYTVDLIHGQTTMY